MAPSQGSVRTLTDPARWVRRVAHVLMHSRAEVSLAAVLSPAAQRVADCKRSGPARGVATLSCAMCMPYGASPRGASGGRGSCVLTRVCPPAVPLRPRPVTSYSVSCTLLITRAYICGGVTNEKGTLVPSRRRRDSVDARRCVRVANRMTYDHVPVGSCRRKQSSRRCRKMSRSSRRRSTKRSGRRSYSLEIPADAELDPPLIHFSASESIAPPNHTPYQPV